MKQVVARMGLALGVGLAVASLGQVPQGLGQVPQGIGAETSMMLMPGSGLVMKVTPKSEKITAFTSIDRSSKAFDLQILAPYFVISEDSGFYRVTDIPARTVQEAEAGNVGYVAKDEVFTWPTREALEFTQLLTSGIDRLSIKAWAEREQIAEFLLTGDEAKFGPTYEEDQSVTRQKERYMRPYPVMQHEEMPTIIGKEKLVYNVLFPSWVNGTGTVKVEASSQEVLSAYQSVSFCVVFDSTASMEPYARELAGIIRNIVRTEAREMQDARLGFVFFRDKGDAVPIDVIEPTGLETALALLQSKADEMSGGGDAPEPVLDALIHTAARYDWVSSQGIAGSRKIALVVLNADAKTETIGLEAVETGLNTTDVARVLQDEGITVVAFQAGTEAGPNLVNTLTVLAEATGGTFAKQVGGREGTTRAFGDALSKVITKTVETEKVTAEKIEREIIPEGDNLTSIPLEVLDPHHLDRLRELAGAYAIDETGGLLVSEGWIPQDENLLVAKISIDKRTLQDLIGFFNVLSTIDVDADSLVATVSRNLEGLVGERVSADEPLEVLAQKVFGVNFQTELLAYNLNYLTALTPPEKLSIKKRMGDAGEKLSTFLEANLVELDSEPTVWMPVSYLP